MKSFIIKYKRTIIFWVIFSAIVLYFAPRQHDYYLDDDIKNFKRNYLTSFLIWSGVVTSIIALIFVLVKTKSVKQAVVALLFVGVTLAFYLFIFQDLFLGAALFLNKQFKLNSLEREYVVSYIADTDQTKDNFIPYDIAYKHSSFDRKLINKLYNPQLKLNDTTMLHFEKGLFGIAFQLQPFVDK